MIGMDSSDEASASETAELVKHVTGFVGVGLCIGIFIYLLRVARRAVDEELDDDEIRDDYELVLSEDEDEEDREAHDGTEHGDFHNTSANNESFEGVRARDYTADDQPLLMQQHMNHIQPQRSAWLDLNTEAANLDVNAKSDFGGARRDIGSDATSANPNNTTLTIGGQHRLAAGDGTTPIFSLPPRQSGDGSLDSNGEASQSYFGSLGGDAASRGNGNISYAGNYTQGFAESQVSLADSIAEMEKHAILMEGPDSEAGHSSPRYVNIDGLHTDHTHGNYSSGDQSRTGRLQPNGLDRNRAERRSQTGYEEHYIRGRGS